MNSLVKKIFSIIGMVFLGIVASLLLYQLFVGIRLATTDFSPFEGLFGSESVGFRNFETFFKYKNVGRLFRNTTVISFLGMYLGAAYVFLSTLATGAIRKTAPKAIVASLFALPLAVPTLAYVVSLFEGLRELGIFELENPQFVIAIISVLPLAALFSLGGLFVSQKPAKSAGKLTLAFVAVKLVIFFVENFEAVYLIQTPWTYEYSETLSTYAYERGIIFNDMSYASAVGVITLLLGIVLAAAGVIILSLLFKRKETLQQGEARFSGGVFASFATVVPVVLTIIALIALGGNVSSFADSGMVIGYINTVSLAITTTLLTGVFTFFMVHAIDRMKLIGTIVVSTLCLLTNNITAQFLTTKFVGLYDTQLGVVFSYLRYLPLIVLVFSIFLKFQNTLGGRLGAGILSAGAGFALAWGEIYSPLLFLDDSSKYTLSLFVRINRLQGDFYGTGVVDCAPYALVPILVLAMFVVAATIFIRKVKKS